MFIHVDENGFDELTWRNRATENIPDNMFAPVTHVDGRGEIRTSEDADVPFDLPLPWTGEAFRMRQISRAVDTTCGGIRQIHILTTNTVLPAGEVIYRMGSGWRQETTSAATAFTSTWIPTTVTPHR